MLIVSAFSNTKFPHYNFFSRFGGQEFPPVILFKVYIHTGGQGLKYISGKRVIKPSTQAACDSLQLMGNRKFYDQMTADLCQHEKDKITDEIDITTMKDYMKVRLFGEGKRGIQVEGIDVP